MTILCIVLAIWAVCATYAAVHNRNVAQEWRTVFMIERGCDTQETRELIARRKNESQ